jgi:hypothetical protein
MPTLPVPQLEARLDELLEHLEGILADLPDPASPRDMAAIERWLQLALRTLFELSSRLLALDGYFERVAKKERMDHPDHYLDDIPALARKVVPLIRDLAGRFLRVLRFHPEELTQQP